MKTTITIEEKNRREHALATAKASIELEGFHITKEYEAQARRFISGEIEFSDLTKYLHEHTNN